MKTLHAQMLDLHDEFIRRRQTAQEKYDAIAPWDRQDGQEAKDLRTLDKMWGDLMETLLPYLDK